MTVTESSEVERAKLEPKRGLSLVQREFTVADVEIRAQNDTSTVVDFYGHATVYGKGYEMYGGPDKGGWIEFVDAGAGKKTLSEKPDVAFLVNHEGLTLARTKAGTLQLREDKVGLEVKAQLDTRVSIVNDIRVLMEAGNLDEMSFGFRVTRQKWLDADGQEVPWWDLAGIERHITEYNLNKGDVSIVNYGANPYTDASVRSLTELVRDYPEELSEDEIRAAITVLESKLPDEPGADLAFAAAVGNRAARDWLAAHDTFA